ncbi:hypothetical protein SESBI_23250 [Sesbania bispinosa]|nr:hypothetical protein SESBI_23250 [Sesbania bispinosa]
MKRCSISNAIRRYESVHLNMIDGVAKVLGVLASVGGASVITLYKGPTIYTPHSASHQENFLSAFGDATGKNWNLGGIFLFGHSLCWSGWIVMQAFVLKKYSAPLTVSAFTCFFGIVQFVTIATFFEKDPKAWQLNSRREIYSVLYSGLVTSGLAAAIQIWTIGKGGPVLASIYLPLQTLLVALMASIVFGEEFFLGGIIGAFLIISGLYLVVWGRSQETKQGSVLPTSVMEAELDPEQQQMMEGSFSRTMQIDPKRARFPCSIVWSPLPVISWFIPFIGHIGICREDGVILDFAGPNFVCVDNFAFGAATRYLQITKEKCPIPLGQSTYKGEEHYMQDETGGDLRTWDDALRKSTQEFQHRAYNLFTCNCHSFVANNLNRLGFLSGGWNVVNLTIFILFNGRWVSKTSMLRTILPFVVVFFLGVTLGGFTFLKFWFLFASVLIGWFLLGTYCFKNMIQL